MLRIALPTKSLKTEEKRNLILRIRYGSLHYNLEQNNKDANFLIQGHTMACRSQKRKVPVVPDYGRRRFFKLPTSKNMTLGITPSHLPTLAPLQAKKKNKAFNNISSKKENLQTSDNDLDFDMDFRFTSLHRGGPLEALHEHSDEDGHNSLDLLNYSNRNEKKVLPEIPSSNTRKMSYIRRYSKESDIDFYNRRNPSRAGSISAWSMSSDRSQMSKPPMSRRRTKRLRSKNGSRRSSKAESEDLEATARYGFHESVDEEKHIWFDYPGFDLTYVDVQQALEKVIPDAFEAKKVDSIVFENVNIKFSSAQSKNKWHVELSDLASKKQLMDSGLIFPNPGRHNTDDRKRSLIGRSGSSRSER